MEYIEREAFLAEQRHLYCENCARRKNGKGKFVYDIGDAPCRACGICDVLDAVEDAPAADVRPVVSGKWEMNSNYPDRFICSECGAQFDCWHWEAKQMHYCPSCGARMEES